ncbi:uncharacterized protein DEA37_0010866 [Paragonimus westermani]|uniref:Reverse transcriptase domain-containing protein n=1 Tax=Paragonimus westermani TaxID=34504 RepID=A0A5J4NSD2_9TREM|nr:uncharacterized protein DEA37_0010866 [Paragonimus westermani]
MSGSPDTYEIMVHPFGATSSPFCAPYALRKTAIDNGHRFSKLASQIVFENFYVDDCLVSVDTLEDAECVASDLREMLFLGGFRLVKRKSNIADALSDIPPNERASVSAALDLGDHNHQEALGVQWHVSEDCFKFRVSLPKKPFTRRGLLACIASVYDLLGLKAPPVLRGRRLLQGLCCADIGWNTPLDEKCQGEWERWSRGVASTDSVTVRRCIRPHGKTPTRSELHMFSDASETGYGAVGYLREVLGDGNIYCCFLMGKSRVAPLKHLSIPRLELTAAVLAAKLMRFIANEPKLTFHNITL